MKVSLSTIASALVAICLSFALFAGPAMAQDSYAIRGPSTQVASDAELLAAINAQAAAAAASQAAAAAAAGGDEVLGIAVTADGAPQLAFTGSNVDTTALIGAALIGSGALAALAGRKRRLSGDR